MTKLSLEAACEKWLLDFGLEKPEATPEATALAEFLRLHVQVFHLVNRNEAHQKHMRIYMAEKRARQALAIATARPRKAPAPPRRQ